MKQVQVIINGALIVTAMASFASVGNAQEVAVENTPHAQVVPPATEAEFGHHGQWYLYAPSLLALHTKYAGTSMTDNNVFGFGAELGTFSRDHFSLGLGIQGQYGWQHQQVFPAEGSDRYANWTAGLSLVAGWQRPLSSWVSFWPKLSVGGTYGRADQIVYEVESGTSSKEQESTYAITTTVRLPLVIHVTRHLFVEVAYQIVVDSTHIGQQYDGLQASTQTTLGLGGWL